MDRRQFLAACGIGAGGALLPGFAGRAIAAQQLAETIDIAVEFLSLPDRIRGYGPVKEKSVTEARARYEQLAKDLVNPPPMVAPQIAAE